MSEVTLHSNDFGIKYLKEKSLQELVYERTKEDLSDLKSDIEGGLDVKINTEKIKDYLTNYTLTLNGTNREFKKIGGGIISKDYASITYVACIQILLKKWTKSQSMLSGYSSFRVDGIFGPRTKEVLQQYSKFHSLTMNSSDFYKDIIDHLVMNIDTIANSVNANPKRPNPIKKPEVKKPEVKKPEVKKPEVKKPEVKKPEVKKPTETNGNLTEVTAEGITVKYLNNDLKKEYQEEIKEFSKQLMLKTVEGKKQTAGALVKTVGINIVVKTYSRYDNTEGNLENNIYYYRTSNKVGKANIKPNINELINQLKH